MIYFDSFTPTKCPIKKWSGKHHPKPVPETPPTQPWCNRRNLCSSPSTMGGLQSTCKPAKNNSTTVVPNNSTDNQHHHQETKEQSHDQLLDAMESGTPPSLSKKSLTSRPLPPPFLLPYQQKHRPPTQQSNTTTSSNTDRSSTNPSISPFSQNTPSGHTATKIQPPSSSQQVQPSPRRQTPAQQLQRLQQVHSNVVQQGTGNRAGNGNNNNDEDVATSGPLLLRRLSLAAVQKEKQHVRSQSLHPHSAQSNGVAMQLPKEKIIGLALRKYFRDADTKHRGYLTSKGIRKAMSSILKSSKLPSPPDTVTNHVMSFLGSPINVSKTKTKKRKPKKNKSGKADQPIHRNNDNGEDTTSTATTTTTTTTTTKTIYVIKENAFTAALRYGGNRGASPLTHHRPPILVLAASLVDMQYDQRIRYIDRLWKMHMIPSTKKMGYEELYELLKHLAPEPRHVPTIDETCLFLGAIKRGSNADNAVDDEYVLSELEFAEYAMRGLYQTKKGKKMFSSRGKMQAKITRCLNSLSEEANDDHVSRRKSLSFRSRTPTQVPAEKSLMMLQFARMEGMVDGE